MIFSLAPKATDRLKPVSTVSPSICPVGLQSAPMVSHWISKMVTTVVFLIDNPNEPKAQDIAVSDVEVWLADNPTAKVYQIGVGADAVLPFATALDASAHTEIDGLSKDHPVAFMCMMGVRSQQAAKALVLQGYNNGVQHRWWCKRLARLQVVESS